MIVTDHMLHCHHGKGSALASLLIVLAFFVVVSFLANWAWKWAYETERET